MNTSTTTTTMNTNTMTTSMNTTTTTVTSTTTSTWCDQNVEQAVVTTLMMGWSQNAVNATCNRTHDGLEVCVDHLDAHHHDFGHHHDPEHHHHYNHHDDHLDMV